MNKTQAQLSTVSDELAMLVEAVQDYAIFFLDPTGGIRSWNRGASRIMGYAADEIIGRHFSTFYTPIDLANEKPRHELETAAAEGRVEDEGWRIRKDGTRFWANTVITALRDDNGTLVGFAKVTRDLTERRNAEERVRQSEELFRLLVSSVKDYAIFMLDATGHIATWNEGARRIKGYEADEIIGKHFSVFYPEEDVRNGKTERELRIAREQGSVEDEGWRIRKDGSRFWALVVITAVHDAAGNLRGFAKVTRDITDRKRADEMRQSLFEQREARLKAEEARREAEASYTAAQETNRAKDEFLMTLSHELRTPMTAILGWSRLLPTLPPGDPMVKEAIASIGRSAELQAQLIDDVLDVSRIISGKLRLERERVDIREIVNGAIESVRAMGEARSVSVVSTVPPDAGSIIVDPTRMQQIIWNLLTNAIKFTPKGGVVTVSARRMASMMEITVTDTGEGIDEAFLPHMFEAFRQAENPRTRIHGGLGLGLSIVRYLTEAHGGSVNAESAGRGKGAKFTVCLPIGAMVPAAVDEHTRNRHPAGTIDREKLSNLSLLVVDDDRESREFLCAVLRHAGARVQSADSAENALTELQHYHPDLIVTDIAMPTVDGFELVKRIRALEEGANYKIVALSAFAPGTSQPAGDPFDAYLTKPIDPAYLVDAVATAARK
jgi:PAS domain S-box-containing protein